MSQSRLVSTEIPKQEAPRKIATHTFDVLIRDWRRHGFESINLQFHQPVHFDRQLKMLTGLVEANNIEEALGYAAQVLKSAEVPGVVRYTLTGR